MRRRKTILIAAATVVAVGIGIGVAVLTRDGGPSRRVSAPADPGPPPPRAERIKVLDAAVATMRRRIDAGHEQWGFLDLRDVFAYRVDQLWHRGIDGAGTTVAVLGGWADPGLAGELATLDDQLGLPHPSVTTIYPTGPLPKKCPRGMVKLGSYGSCDAWRTELRLDVMSVHLMAPYARIVISATPSDTEIEGDASSQVAMPELMKAARYISTKQLADVISISDGSSETDYLRGAAEITAQDPGPLTAAAHGIPIVASTGDCGVAQNLATATEQCGVLSPGPAVGTWSDSPYVTAVGGSRPVPAGTRAGSFVLDPRGNAGLSTVYRRPSYQDGVASVTGSPMRALPDITMDSGFGTSQSAPMFAGVLALATQVHDGPLGCINAVLYEQLGRRPGASGLVDVTAGHNSIGDIPGYSAGPGYDVASGWGTVDAAVFVPALARAAGPDALRRQAARELAARQATLSVRTREQFTVDVSSRGLLPDHPVRLSVDGAPLATVTADSSGTTSYSFRDRRLAGGRHVVHASSLLLEQEATFTVAAS